jgi:uncharacterized membrane protein YgdD (TMEM256/DUF423 family)
MNTSTRAVALAGALLSLSAVILAAMGGHLIDMKGLQSIWETASVIHMFNAVALIALAALLANMNSRLLIWGAWVIVLGTVAFCGSIYFHVVSGQLIPNVAPAGGMLMMAGWFLVVVAFIRRS